MLALDVKMEALKCPIVWLNNAYLFILLLGVCGGGVEGLKWASSSCWRLRRKLSPSWPSLCIESVPVWLLSQFPQLLNIGRDRCCRGGLGLPPRSSAFVVPFWRESLKVGLDYSSSRYTPNLKAHDFQTGRGIQGTKGHFWSTCAVVVRHLYVWSKLYQIYIQVSGKSTQ